jgi:hypothetical protein
LHGTSSRDASAARPATPPRRRDNAVPHRRQERTRPRRLGGATRPFLCRGGAPRDARRGRVWRSERRIRARHATRPRSSVAKREADPAAPRDLRARVTARFTSSVGRSEARRGTIVIVTAPWQCGEAGRAARVGPSGREERVAVVLQFGRFDRPLLSSSSQ